MNTIFNTGCSDVSQEDADNQAKTKIKTALDKVAEEVNKRLQRISDDFDRDTNHGETQGAKLNINITCP